MPIVVRARNFAQEVLEAKGFALVDFYGEQCMPCRLLRPILVELSREFEGLKFCMFNTDRDPRESEEEYEDKFDILAAFHVMNLPTMLLFHDGELVSTLIGLHTREELLAIFREQNVPMRQILPELPAADEDEAEEKESV